MDFVPTNYIGLVKSWKLFFGLINVLSCDCLLMLKSNIDTHNIMFPK